MRRTSFLAQTTGAAAAASMLTVSKVAAAVLKKRSSNRTVTVHIKEPDGAYVCGILVEVPIKISTGHQASYFQITDTVPVWMTPGESGVEFQRRLARLANPPSRSLGEVPFELTTKNFRYVFPDSVGYKEGRYNIAFPVVAFGLKDIYGYLVTDHVIMFNDLTNVPPGLR